MSASSRWRNRAATALGVLVLLAGLTALFWSDIASFASQQGFNQQIDCVSALRQELSGAASDSADELSGKARAYHDAHPVLSDYNKSLAKSQPAVNDAFSYVEGQDVLASCGLDDDLIGSVSIPSMSCRLPLYFGSSEQNMAKGATVVAGTSLPLGGPSTNCVIAAHRGWNTALFFREIEQVKRGDCLTLETPWALLSYEAIESKIIDPNDTDAVKIRPGEDLVTILTCHPYGSNATRYLVVFQRADGPGAHGAASADAHGAAGAGDATGAGNASAQGGGGHDQGLSGWLAPGGFSAVTLEHLLKALGLGLAVAALTVGGYRALRSLADRESNRRNHRG